MFASDMRDMTVAQVGSGRHYGISAISRVPHGLEKLNRNYYGITNATYPTVRQYLGRHTGRGDNEGQGPCSHSFEDRIF